MNTLRIARHASYLLIPLLLLGGCAGTTPESSGVGPTGRTSSPRSTIEIDVFDSVNEARANGNRARLAWSDDIAALARAHSEAMAAGTVPFGHAGIAERLQSAMASRGARAGAENVSRQPRAADEVAPRSMERRLGSDEHRENLLGAYGVTGVGVARAANGLYYVTQIFVR